MLKSVYFGSMEFKVVVYILLGIIWLFSKMLNTKDKRVKPMPGQPRVEKPEMPVPVPVVGKKMQPRATKRVPAPVNQPVSLESQSGLEAAAVNRLKRQTMTNRTPAPVLMEVQQLEEDEWQANGSSGAQIAAEIKNGTMDWKRAVVINELLTRRG